MIRKLMLVMAGALPGLVLAQVPERSFSLEEAKSYALENGYSIHDRQLEVEKARASIRQALALSLPQFSANYNTIWNAQIQPQAIGRDAGFIPPEQFPPGQDFIYLPFGTEYQTQWDVAANVNFSYSNLLARRASVILEKTRDLALEDARIELVNEVEKSYYSVLVARENVRLLDENLESLNQNFTETRKLYENGFIEEQSVDQLELLVANLRDNLHNAERQEELAMMMLKFNMGMPQDSTITLSQDIDSFLSIADEAKEAAGPSDFDPSSHVRYRQAESQYDAAQLNVKNERSQWAPSITAGVTHTEAYFSNEFDPVNWDTYWAPGTRVTGGLSWNLNVVGRPAIIQEAKINAMQSEVAKELTYNQLQLQYKQALNNYYYALESYNTQERNVELSKKIRNKERVKFREGLSGSLDLTQAENQFLESQQNYIQALQTLLQAREELHKALGQR